MLSLPFGVGSSPQADLGDFAPDQLPEAVARVVLVNGRFNATLSDINDLPAGVVVGSLAELLQGELEAPLRARLAQSAGAHEVFTALNTVGFPDAAVVLVPRDRILEAPIQVVSLSVTDETPLMACPRCLVIAEAGSALTLVETFSGGTAQGHFTNSVTEVWADDMAQVTHVRLQREGCGTFHIGKTAVTQARDSRYTSLAVNWGARLARHNLEVYQAGPQTETRLYGLTEITEKQLSDTHSLIALNHPHSTADQLHKAIVDGQAHSVFNGKVWVSKDAQFTNASQLNRNLLLSSKARVDTKPELDIVADNVKCAHGATVSQLNASELFYLQSRGIDVEAAQRLLLYGFAMEVVEQIPVSSLKNRLTDTVAQLAQSSAHP